MGESDRAAGADAGVLLVPLDLGPRPVADRDLIDALAVAGPLTAAELAARVGLAPGALPLRMASLLSLGIVGQAPTGYVLTDLGRAQLGRGGRTTSASG